MGSAAEFAKDRDGETAAARSVRAAAALPRIFLYAMNYAPELTGVGRYSGEMGSYLAERVGVVEVLTTAPHYPGWSVRAPYPAFGYRRETIDGAVVTRCPMILRTDMRGLWRILAPLSFALFSSPVAFWRIFRFRPDTVLVVEPTLFVAPVALLAARLVGARTVLHVQDLEIDAGFAVGHMSGKLPRRIAEAFERLLLLGFDRVVTISNEMGARLGKKGVPESRVAIVRNWVDARKIVPLPRMPNGFRGELGLSEQIYVALYAGNIGKKQALHVVMEAAERLQSQPNIVFVIAGDGPEKAMLQARYAHLPNLRFLPLQPEERLCELLNLADMHLLPQDGCAADVVLPSKLGGMLATGRDILVSADPSTELHNFLSGHAILVPAGNSARMAEEISARAAEQEAPDMKPNPLVYGLDTETNLASFAELILAKG